MFNPWYIRERIGNIRIRPVNPSKGEIAVGAIGLLGGVSFFLSPTSYRVEANMEERQELSGYITNITIASTYLEDLYPVIASPTESEHIIGAGFDDTTYETPEEESERIRLEALNYKFQSLQNDSLIGDTLRKVDAADSPEEAAGSVALTLLSLEDEQQIARQALEETPSYETIQTGNKGRRVALGMGMMGLTAAGLVARRRSRFIQRLGLRLRAAYDENVIDRKAAAFRRQLDLELADMESEDQDFSAEA